MFKFANINSLVMSTLEQIQEEVLIEEKVSLNNEIVLYNDEVNTFDHVIETLIMVCEHTAEQAEQCAILVHYKGKCTVKTGILKELTPKCTQLLEAGLSAEII
jgi:ATP-dependent Clp protease adaptor protein ClpS